MIRHVYNSGGLSRFFNNYKLSFIELRGIEVAEVCQIFERINQAGKSLNMFDIVVAKTYRLWATSQSSTFGASSRNFVMRWLRVAADTRLWVTRLCCKCSPHWLRKPSCCRRSQHYRQVLE